MPIDKSPLVIKEFKGKLVTDSDYLDTTLGEQKQIKVPFEYSLDNTNLNFLKKGGLRTREGIDKYIYYANATYRPIQMWKIEVLNGVAQTDRWLIFTNEDAGTGAKFYDTGSTIGNPILTIASRAEFAYVINAFGRMYITVWEDYGKGPQIAGSIRVYNGLYAPRAIRGTDPALGAFAVSAVAGGFVTPGLHYCSVLFETDTGFITSCIPDHLLTPVPASMSVTTTAANATIRFANIPVGGAGTGVIKRHLIVTKVVVNPTDKGFFGYEPFIAHTIDDNTTVTYDFTGPDYALLESAKNYLPTARVADVPYIAPWGCASMAVYGNRMVYMLPNARCPEAGGEFFWDKDLIIVSDANRPEQFDITVNMSPAASRPKTYEGSRNAILIGPDFSGPIRAGAELNSVFYIFKDDSTFSIVNDDAADPSEWQKPALIDSGKGAFPFAVANVGNSPSNNLDGALLVGGKHGLTFFNGKFDPKSLAEAIWDQYSFEDLKWLKVLVDPIRQLIFLRVGSFYEGYFHKMPPGDTANNRVVIGNYYYGTGITEIRWGGWKYPIDHEGNAWTYISDIALRQPGTHGNDGHDGGGNPLDYDSLYSLLCLLWRKLIAGTTYDFRIFSEGNFDRDFRSRGANAVFQQWSYETGFTPNKSGEVYTFGPLKLRIRVGDGGGLAVASNLVTVEKCLFDSTTWATIGTFDPGNYPGKYFSLNVNAYSEHMRLRISGSNRVLLDELVLYVSETALDRPRV